jgi:3-phytase
MKPGAAYLLSIAALLGACTDAPQTVASTAPVETLSISAVGETAAVASAEDAADDPAVWRDPADPTRSLIVATDKKAGLNVYDLKGQQRATVPAGSVNNVDLRGDVLLNGRSGVLVGASDRNDLANGHLALYALTTEPVGLRLLARTPANAGEAYGFCFWRRAADQKLFAFVVFKEGHVRQLSIDVSGPAPKVAVVREFSLATQAEGCVADDRTGMLYVAEEDVGVWRVPAAPETTQKPEMFAAVDNAHLVADVEGVAILPDGAGGGFLLISSQGDNAYAAYDLASGKFVRRFRIAPSGDIGGTSETDGIEFAPGQFGAPFGDGLFIAQDGDNAPRAQNFKFVSGDALRALLTPN